MKTMRGKLVLLMALGVLLSSAGSAAAATTLKKLGAHPFYKPSLNSVQDLQDMVAAHQADLSSGFAMAGEASLFEAFQQQFPTVQINSVEFQPGERLQWMLYRRAKKVRVLKDVTWGGKKPFKAYQFAIEKDGRRYTFVVPLICGNLGLKGVGAVPPAPQAAQAPPPPPAPVPNQPPVCRLQLSAERVFSGQQVAADAGDSNDPDGSIASVTFVMLDDKGQRVDQKTVDKPPFVAQMVLPAQGTYRLRATVTDNAGAQVTSSACEKSVRALRRGFPLADVGFFRQFDPGNYVALRIGYEYRLSESLSLVGLIGGFPQVQGNQGASAFTIDGLVNYRWMQRFFAGIGIGGWITGGDQDLDAEDSQVDLVANVGVRVFGDPEAFNTSLYIEGRSAFDEFDDLSKYGRFGVGLRFQF